ncbi:MAG: hypothetical protein KGQ16_00710 [Cyanobacteria bacterium REEB444]|nr:hypothetical protein [Cyanobacteria bacterium REEB444]
MAMAMAAGVPSIAAIPPATNPLVSHAVNAALFSGFICLVMCRINYPPWLFMEEHYVPLSKFDIEPSIDDLFWEEKIKRAIQDCNSVNALKEMATLLARIATQRQGVIKGLVKDIHVFNNVLIDANDIANPELKS